MRILLVAHAFPPAVGGVETYLGALRRHLRARGHAVTVLVGGEPMPGDSETHVTRRSALTRENLVMRGSSMFAELTDSLRKVAAGDPRFDLVHVHNAHHFGPELASALFAVFPADCLINTVHDRIGEHLYPEVLAMPWARNLVVSKYLLGNIPPAVNAQLLYLGVDYEVLLAAAEPDEYLCTLDRPLIFVPARLLPWKGQSVALRTFSEIHRRLGRGTLVLCGSELIVDGPTAVRAYRAQLEYEALNLGVNSHLHFGSFAPERIGAAYRASDVVWCPTVDEEPFGLVPLEAMAIGIPVVVTRSGGMIETVIDGTTGIIVPRGDSTALANATLALLRDSGLRDRLRTEGRRRAEEFAIGPHIDSLESIYWQVSQARR